MIFAGNVVKIFSPPYLARYTIMEQRENKSLEKFLDDMWVLRDLSQQSSKVVKSSLSWPIARPQIPEQSVVPIKQRVSR